MAGSTGCFALSWTMAALWLAGCATNPADIQQRVDPIFIPETAADVGQISLRNANGWTGLNNRMAVMWAGNDPHLLVFNTPCRALMGGSPFLVQTSSSMLRARFDKLTPYQGASCRIDFIYRILREDVDALKEVLHPQPPN